MSTIVDNRQSSDSQARLILAWALAFAGLFLLSRSDFLLFHSIVELIGVVVAFSIFIIAWNARRLLDNGFLLFIGIGFLFVGVLGLMHTLSYRGMGVFIGYEPVNLAAQFWIATRFIQAAVLLAASAFILRRLNVNAAFLGFGVLTILTITSILVWRNFPQMFDPDAGLTTFKIAGEFFITFILVLAIANLRRNRVGLDRTVVGYLTGALLANIASEMAFTLYTDAYGLLNTAGHLLLITSIYFIYKALIETGLRKPFDLLFRQLRKNEEKYRLLFNSGSDAVFFIDEGDKFVEVNDRACEVLGYSRAELLTMGISDIDDPTVPTDKEAVIQQIKDKGFAVFERLHVAKDGRRIPVELNARQIQVDGRPMFLSVARDISERKRAEKALRESESKLKLKLDYILSPEVELGENDLTAVFDLPLIQQMMDDLYTVTGIGFSIIDLKGKVLVGTGWQEICTDFHRRSPRACANCIESDLALTAGVNRGEFKTYKCKNNMWDIVTPLYIADRHIANVFTGQFFFDDEKPDVALFSRQADEFGFDKKEYFAALEKAPRHSRCKVAALMDFFTRFANMISEMGYNNLKLAKAITDQRQAIQRLAETKTDLDRAQDVAHVGSWRMDVRRNVLEWSGENYRIFGIPAGTPLTYETFLSTIHPEDRQYVDAKWQAGLRGEPYDIEHRLLVGGREKWVREKAYLEFDEDGSVIGGFGITHDITDRKELEANLTRAAMEWQATFDSITDVIMLLDRHHKIIRTNRAFETTFHIPASEAVGKHCHDIVHGLGMAPGFCPHSRTMSCAGSAREEFFEPKLGIYIEATTLPTFNSEGECSGSVHIIKNIHERKTAETEREDLLRQVENQRLLLETTLEQFPSGVVIRNTAGELVMGNEEVRRIFGQLPQNIAEFDASCCYRKDGTHFKTADWPMNRTVVSGEVILNEEIEIIKPDGEHLTVLTSTGPVRDVNDETIAHVGVFRDITERKLTERRLEILSRFPAENPNPVMRVDPHGTILYVNPASRYVLNCWSTTVQHRLPEDLCVLVRESLNSGFDQHVEVQCGDRVFAFSITPVTEFRYVNLYGRDITERKQAEQALQQLNTELEDRVRIRTLELTEAHSKLLEQLRLRAEAEESLRSLSGRLLRIQEEERRNIARELHDQTGQSLTVLKLMIGRADRLATEELKPLLRDIATMTADIIKQVRSLSVSLRPGVLDDLGLVSALDWLFKQLGTQAGLHVRFEHSPLPELNSDVSTAVYRITQEALTNVMRHSGATEAAVVLNIDGRTLHLAISDRGRGFDPEAMAASSSTGLSAIRERAALLGGYGKIESSPGNGTTVIISVPLPEEPALQN
ncbi:MASE3 domain-containing protein [Dehalogenimonas sp. 4OHTPN]|uniref:Oxygen sensor histidine kinase NreB n=1 Tax=Dehalogenimonas sp. 4OHTPN TaxID=3166643 RepID=A0AAU8GB94_9CHLR